MSAAESGEGARCARAEEASEVEAGTDVSRETSAVCSAAGADAVAAARAAAASTLVAATTADHGAAPHSVSVTGIAAHAVVADTTAHAAAAGAIAARVAAADIAAAAGTAAATDAAAATAARAVAAAPAPLHEARTVDAAEMQRELAAFKDPQLARGLIESIGKLAPVGGATLMEVCGTHTVAIARNGIRNLMPPGTRLASGPGCPVCVTSNRDIDTVIALTRIPNVTIATFGDMTRVPGSTSSLLKEQAAGRSVQIVYSPLDALALAAQHPEREIVFVGVGFETTTPLVAMAIKRAAAADLKNFTVFAAHKNMPGALEAIINDPQLKLDALILPGHVSTIIGAAPYEFLAKKYGIPGVITGFEPVDVLQGIAMIMRQLHEGRAEIEIAYARGVMPQGNPTALAAIDEVFETCPAIWRGLGRIDGSGYRIRDEFARFDAVRRFQPDVEPTQDPKGCRCGDVLRGIMAPSECPLFRTVCTPENPVGPCMVSSEGSCAAYYRYY